MSNAQTRPECMNVVSETVDAAYAVLESSMVTAKAVCDFGQTSPLVAVSAAFEASFLASKAADTANSGIWGTLVNAWVYAGPEELLPFLQEFKVSQLNGLSVRKALPENKTKHDTIGTYLAILKRTLEAGFNPADYSGKNALIAALDAAEGKPVKAPKAPTMPADPAAVSNPGQTPASGQTCQYTQALLMVTAMLKEGKAIDPALQGAISELVAQAHKSLPVKAIEQAFHPAAM